MAAPVTEQTTIERIIQNYRNAVAENPGDPAVHMNLGYGLHSAGRHEEAVISFQRALDLDRNMLDAHFGVGLSYKSMQENAAAKNAFEQVISLADQLEDANRASILKRLAVGHIHEMESGEWGLHGVTSLM